ncbi:hypothetical protein P12x_005234 [Tundrisphaera lichenicola]|uniref:hypothetical protein n=1 Tax=Tundrisphaera lichenicola TaxID=2029860 RepID=UPI003EBCF47E
MSSVTVPLYHYALLKGYLAGQNAPSEALAAVEALYMAAIQGPLRADALDAIQAVKEAAERLAGMAATPPTVQISQAKTELRIDDQLQSAEFHLPPLTRRALEKAAERVTAPAASGQPQTDDDKITAFLEAKAVEQCPPAHANGDGHEVVVGLAEPKKRKEWSPEARAAAAERMRARQAAGLIGRRKNESSPEPASPPEPAFEIRKASKPEPEPAPEPKPLPAVDPSRLITVHTGFAGKREDGQLRDEDWPDIKPRLARGETKAAIAGDYEAEVDDLDYFIASCQRREAKRSLGEAPAPLAS